MCNTQKKDMKYKFIAAIHYMELENENTLIPLASGYISNRKPIIEDIMYNELSLTTLGLHSIDEIREAPSFYIVDGDWGDNLLPPEIDTIGTSLCFALLRQIQHMVGKLWRLKDNSIYVRDGFLYSYTDNIADGCTFKASVSAINTFSNGEQKIIKISNSDLLAYGKEMDIFPIGDVINHRQDYRTVTQLQHYKKSSLCRKDLAEVYVNMARMEGSIPMKILLYCSAMEALVANSTTELSHRVAERIAILIGNSQEERCEIYSNVKNGYDTRSKVAHGDFLKKDEIMIQQYSMILDNYLRQLLQLEEPYNMDSREIDAFYLNKLME